MDFVPCLTLKESRNYWARNMFLGISSLGDSRVEELALANIKLNPTRHSESVDKVERHTREREKKKKKNGLDRAAARSRAAAAGGGGGPQSFIPCVI